MTAEASFVGLLASVEAWEAVLAEDDPRLDARALVTVPEPNAVQIRLGLALTIAATRVGDLKTADKVVAWMLRTAPDAESAVLATDVAASALFAVAATDLRPAPEESYTAAASTQHRYGDLVELAADARWRRDAKVGDGFGPCVQRLRSIAFPTPPDKQWRQFRFTAVALLHLYRATVALAAAHPSRADEFDARGDGPLPTDADWIDLVDRWVRRARDTVRLTSLPLHHTSVHLARSLGALPAPYGVSWHQLALQRRPPSPGIGR